MKNIGLFLPLYKNDRDFVIAFVWYWIDCRFMEAFIKIENYILLLYVRSFDINVGLQPRWTTTTKALKNISKNQ